MTANYHTHTARCHHAQGTEREYIEAAIQRGLTVLGFSDHAPHFFGQCGYVSDCRMLPHELEDYVRTLTDLRREYRDRIDIRIGLELDYYPARFEETVRHILSFPEIEYLIYGQHWLSNEYDSTWVGDTGADETALIRYTLQVKEALSTGLYSCFCHPDFFRFDGDKDVYRRHMEPLLRWVKEKNLPIELNLSGYLGNRWYPKEFLWELAAEVGCRVILGVDAHKPSSLIETETEKRAMDLCRRLNIIPEDTMTLIDPRR
jgi:histidinol-phosphatase (PHP family)